MGKTPETCVARVNTCTRALEEIFYDPSEDDVRGFWLEKGAAEAIRVGVKWWSGEYARMIESLRYRIKNLTKSDAAGFRLENWD